MKPDLNKRSEECVGNVELIKAKSKKGLGKNLNQHQVKIITCNWFEVLSDPSDDNFEEPSENGVEDNVEVQEEDNKKKQLRLDKIKPKTEKKKRKLKSSNKFETYNWFKLIITLIDGRINT